MWWAQQLMPTGFVRKKNCVDASCKSEKWRSRTHLSRLNPTSTWIGVMPKHITVSISINFKLSRKRSFSAPVTCPLLFVHECVLQDAHHQNEENGGSKRNVDLPPWRHQHLQCLLCDIPYPHLVFFPWRNAHCRVYHLWDFTPDLSYSSKQNVL